jgi:pimeloyl-ACP methyl ester carboxylesterase
MVRAHRALLLTVLGVVGCESDPTAPVPLGFGEEVRLPSRREIEVGFRSADGIVLSGTLILPLDGSGPWPAIVMHFGSDRWTRATYGAGLRFWIDNGIAVLTYDKRGVGKSQGECCPWKSPGYFPLLAEDVAAAARTVKTHPEIDGSRVGAWGFSQGGWVVPLAASIAPEAIAWMIIGSGPAVSLGEELLYSQLTGDDACQPSGLAADEIERQLDEAGPSGYDPRPVLGGLATPGYWIYGALDTSVPVARSVRVLDSLRTLGRPFDSIVIPRLNHVWIRDGGMCQSTGQGGVEGEVIASWLWPRLGREPPPVEPPALARSSTVR